MVYKGKMVFMNVLVVWNKIWKVWRHNYYNYVVKKIIIITFYLKDYL